MKSNTALYAQRELEILSKAATDPGNRPIIEPFIPEILALCEKFGLNGESGGSAPYTASAISQAIKKLCLQEPICPVTGIDEEWMDISESMGGNVSYQNTRCSCLFKDKKEGQPYYLDAIVWKGDTVGESGNSWDTFTGNVEGILSRQYVKSFPFTPKTFYIDVTREQLPEDWTEEPFIQGNDYYITSEYERTGEKIWHKDIYRYKIKNKKQLERVWRYYNRCE